MKRLLLGVLLVCALLVTACSGSTDPASNVGSTSAQINGHGYCDGSVPCTAWGEWRKVGTSTWNATPVKSYNPGTYTDHATITGLSSSTQYEYRMAGRQNQGVSGDSGVVRFDSTGTSDFNGWPSGHPVYTTFTTSAASTTTTLGIDAGGWGGSFATDAASFGMVRWDKIFGSATDYTSQTGKRVIALFSGPYNSNGVAGIGDPTSWANSQLSWYQANCSTTSCPWVEILNEPGGSWFWGSNAYSQTNATNYAALVKATYNVFHNAYGSSAPKTLVSADGGTADTNSSWWNWYSGAGGAPYADQVTVHPYGGHSCTSYPTSCPSADGNRSDVTQAHNDSGKPVFITEVGWPTDCSSGCPTTTNETGDSLQWSLTQQAHNIYNFAQWAKGTGYVSGVSFFEYRNADDSSGNQYGLETNSGTKKPSWTALQEAQAGQSCTVC